MPTLFYYTGKIKESSSHPQSTFMVLLHLLTIMVNSNPRIPFVTQDSQFVNESPGL